MDFCDIDENNVFKFPYTDGQNRQKTKEMILDENDDVWTEFKHKHIGQCDRAAAPDAASALNALWPCPTGHRLRTPRVGENASPVPARDCHLEACSLPRPLISARLCGL